MNNVCACLGAAYGEPYCYCEMQQRGLQSLMDNNPARKAAEYDSAQQWEKFIAEGGYEQLTRKK